MDKLSRAHRITSLLNGLPDYPELEPGFYFGEHVIRVAGLMCFVVTLDGRVGIRATDADLEAELQRTCGDQHWISHGRVYEQWYVLPETVYHNTPQLNALLHQAADGAARLSAQQPSPARIDSLADLFTR